MVEIGHREKSGLMHNNYEFNFDYNKKIYTIKLKGCFTEEAVSSLKESYQEAIGKLNPIEYSLIIDNTELQFSASKMIPYMQECMQMYLNTGFRCVFMTKPNSVLTMLQAKEALEEFNGKFFYIK